MSVGYVERTFGGHYQPIKWTGDGPIPVATIYDTPEEALQAIRDRGWKLLSSWATFKPPVMNMHHEMDDAMVRYRTDDTVAVLFGHDEQGNVIEWRKQLHGDSAVSGNS